MMPADILGALAKLEFALAEWEPVPEHVAHRLAEFKASLDAWPRVRACTLVAPSHGRWIRTPEGRHLDLRRRRALRRLVRALVDARVERPGHPLSSADLIAAGWPDEQALSSDMALNRLYVALTRLRQIGLMDILVSVRGGWMITTGIVIEREEAGADSETVPVAQSYVRELAPPPAEESTPELPELLTLAV